MANTLKCAQLCVLCNMLTIHRDNRRCVYTKHQCSIKHRSCVSNSFQISYNFLYGRNLFQFYSINDECLAIHFRTYDQWHESQKNNSAKNYWISSPFVCHWMNQKMLCFAVPISSWRTDRLSVSVSVCVCLAPHLFTNVLCTANWHFTKQITKQRKTTWFDVLSIVQHHFVSIAIAIAFVCASCTHSCNF